jgi:hypothetical protein
LAEQGRTPDQADQAEMEALWIEAKGLETAPGGTCSKVIRSEAQEA